MITIKNAHEIECMKHAGLVTYEALQAVKAAVRPGVTTLELDRVAEERIRSLGGVPSFKGYEGFPGSICASIDDEVVHGIPSARRVLHEGSIISIDCGAIVDGFQGDSALTVCVGSVDERVRLLVERTEQSFWEALKVITDGARLGDIGHAVQSYCEGFGYGVVRELCGHGIGREMHEDPEVLNYGRRGTGIRLRAGMTIAVEPMITLGSPAVYRGKDGWKVATVDASPASHYEHTVLVTKGEPVILTLPENFVRKSEGFLK